MDHWRNVAAGLNEVHFLGAEERAGNAEDEDRIVSI